MERESLSGPTEYGSSWKSATSKRRARAGEPGPQPATNAVSSASQCAFAALETPEPRAESQERNQADRRSEHHAARTIFEADSVRPRRYLHRLERSVPAFNRHGMSIDRPAPAWIELLD